MATVVITFAGSVPLNDALMDAGPVAQIYDLAAVRADFESSWVVLNVLRTLTSTGSVACRRGRPSGFEPRRPMTPSTCQ